LASLKQVHRRIQLKDRPVALVHATYLAGVVGRTMREWRRNATEWLVCECVPIETAVFAPLVRGTRKPLTCFACIVGSE
jgi:hypothetical protein